MGGTNDNPLFFSGLAFFIFSVASMYTASSRVLRPANQNDDYYNNDTVTTFYESFTASAVFTIMSGFTMLVAAVLAAQSTEAYRNMAFTLSLALYALARVALTSGEAKISWNEPSHDDDIYDDKVQDASAQGNTSAAVFYSSAMVCVAVAAFQLHRQASKTGGAGSLPSVWMAFLGFMSLAFGAYVGGTAAQTCDLYSNAKDTIDKYDLDDDAITTLESRCGGVAWATAAGVATGAICFLSAAVTMTFKEDLGRTRKALWVVWFIVATLMAAGVGGYYGGEARATAWNKKNMTGDDYDDYISQLPFIFSAQAAATVLAVLASAVALLGGLITLCAAPGAAEAPSRPRLMAFHFSLCLFYAAYASYFSVQAHSICLRVAEDDYVDDDNNSTLCQGYTGTSTLSAIAAFIAFVATLISAFQSLSPVQMNVAVNSA